MPLSPSPETRASLLIRLKVRADQAAWTEFVEIYQPVIRRLALRRGMQSADADDVSQQVVFAVSKAIRRWDIDPQRGKFRTWLHRVAHNAILNALTRGSREFGSGDSDLLRQLEQQPDRGGPDSDLLRLEFRREQFRWAARQIQEEFQSATWDAFWLTSVEGVSPEEAAVQLKKGIGSIYAARSRVMRRLKEKLAEIAAHSA